MSFDPSVRLRSCQRNMISKRTVSLSAAALAGGGLAAYAVKRARRPLQDLTGQVVLITGGSRGLGFELACEFAELGCKIAICARDEAQLEKARHELMQRHSIDVWTASCDVSDIAQVEDVVRRATQHFGRVDILVANAGIISVGPIESVRLDDFHNAMNVMFWGVLHPIWAVLPQMRERGSGRIVTITSIGGKISIPHLIPYSCAKFAAVALSEGLRSELKPQGIDVLTIVPGLMRTGSHLNAQFKGQQDREFAWFGIGASTPGLSINVNRAARQIVKALRRGESHRVLTLPAQILARVHGAFPEVTSWALQIVNRLLPDPAREESGAITGLEAQERLNSSLHRAVTGLGRSAARDTLQI